MGLTKLGALVALMLTAGAGQDPGLERLYGRVYTAEGEVVEGFIRWDRNEASWTDYLDGAKEIPVEYIREAESLDPDFAAQQRDARSIVAFGQRITWDEDDESDPFMSSAAIRFGHVESLVALDGQRVLLRLRGGGQVELRSSSTDIGRGMRRVVIDVPGEDAVSLRWRELDRIEFLPVPRRVQPSARRMYGTVTTWGDLELTGNIAWDLDEILSTDILDGSEGRIDHEIPFSDIATIAWESSRSSMVTLRSGATLEVEGENDLEGTEPEVELEGHNFEISIELRGTNDVNRENRGIEISDVAFGRATVHWEDFKSVRFHDPEIDHAWPDFDPASPIRGTVYARDGRVLEGEIRWGNDETQLWEALDGWIGDTRFDIEFGAITSVARLDDERVSVTLLDGRTFELDGSDDVDENNRGIYVKPEGRARRLVRWRDFDRAVFVR
jgi:hypothetical protein